MTIPRKKSRPIEVDGRKFRFLIKPARARGEDLSVTVQEEAVQPGRVLQFTWPEGCSIFPEDVKVAIRDGLKLGWAPSAKGPAFRFGHPKASTVNNDE